MASSVSCSGKRVKYNPADDRTAFEGPLCTSWTQPLRLGAESQLQQLLPGIPDDITLSYITTKLSWMDSHMLPLLSRSWTQAIQRRHVYNARVQSDSTETLVLLSCKIRTMRLIALYSMRDETLYFLPPIPGVDRGIPSGCQCVSSDGRVYILGGMQKKTQSSVYFALRSVYVLDLAGQRKWRRCANMPQPRAEFGCSFLDGKIYVFGGIIDDEPVRGSLVYDPKVNCWSQIAPTPSLRWGHDVVVWGGELFQHSGYIYDLNNSDSEEDEDVVPDHRPAETLVLEAYNPARNEWREVETVPRLRGSMDERVFFENGVSYVMTGRAIYRHDTERSRWTKVHTFFCAALGPARQLFVEPTSVLAGNGVLLATFYWCRADNDTRGTSLLQSRGFGGNRRKIVWRKVNCFGRSPVLHQTVQL